MTHVPMGIFRDVERPTYDDQVRAQVSSAVEVAGGPADDAALTELLHGHDTWSVLADPPSPRPRTVTRRRAEAPLRAHPTPQGDPAGPTGGVARRCLLLTRATPHVREPSLSCESTPRRDLGQP